MWRQALACRRHALWLATACAAVQPAAAPGFSAADTDAFLHTLLLDHLRRRRRPVREQGLRRALAAGIDMIAHGEEVFSSRISAAHPTR
ncbi:MAG TPA: hypothetical protein VMN60_09890 [Longimicrobiales bacterium]|nr:hypothetical protein [Longimicrobiales bacterium]